MQETNINKLKLRVIARGSDLTDETRDNKDNTNDNDPKCDTNTYNIAVLANQELYYHTGRCMEITVMDQQPLKTIDHVYNFSKFFENEEIENVHGNNYNYNANINIYNTSMDRDEEIIAEYMKGFCLTGISNQFIKELMDIDAIVKKNEIVHLYVYELYKKYKWLLEETNGIVARSDGDNYTNLGTNLLPQNDQSGSMVFFRDWFNLVGFAINTGYDNVNQTNKLCFITQNVLIE